LFAHPLDRERRARRRAFDSRRAVGLTSALQRAIGSALAAVGAMSNPASPNDPRRDPQRKPPRRSSTRCGRRRCRILEIRVPSSPARHGRFRSPRIRVCLMVLSERSGFVSAHACRCRSGPAGAGHAEGAHATEVPWCTLQLGTSVACARELGRWSRHQHA
jgi:hypothetical protein